MGKVYWSAIPLPAEDQIPSLRDYLAQSFPLEDNRGYLERLMGNARRAALPRVVLARLSALSLLPPMLARVGISPSNIRLTRDENGRPHGQDVSGTGLTFDFNLSHSDGHAACALLIGDGRVGLDIEELLTPERATPLIQRYCTDGERKWLSGRTDEEQAQIFTRIWTMREAICKQDGRGMPLRFDASLVPESIRVFSAAFRHSGTHISICAPVGASQTDLIQVSAFPDVSWICMA